MRDVSGVVELKRSVEQCFCELIGNKHDWLGRWKEYIKLERLYIDFYGSEET